MKVDGEVLDLDRASARSRRRRGRDRHGALRTDALDLVRHDAAHVLAAAIIDLYPGMKIAIGPPIEDGFYYDFEFPEGVTVTDADFAGHRGRDEEARQGRGAVRPRGRLRRRRAARASSPRTSTTRSS